MIRLLVAMLLLCRTGRLRTAAELYVDGPRLAIAELGPGPAPSYRGAITVAPVSVGTDTSVPWTSQIGAADFQEALVADAEARQSGGRAERPLSPRRRPAEARAALCRLRHDRHRPGRLSIDRDRDRRLVYQETRTSLGTASLNDAVPNTDRLRIADERALRADLRKLVEDLYALPERGPLTSSPRT